MDQKKLSEIIRQRREELGLTHSQIAEELKIPERYLKYLEKNELSKLPALIYVEGFLNKYGEMIGLDKKRITRLYEYEIEEYKKKLDKKILLSPALSAPRAIVTPKKIALAFLGLLLLVFGGYLWKQVNFFIDEPSFDILSPEDGIIISKNKVIVHGKTERDNIVTINGQVSSVGENGEFSEEIFLQDGLNNLAVTAKNPYGKESTVNKEVFVDISAGTRLSASTLTKKIQNDTINNSKAVNDVVFEETMSELSMKIKTSTKSSWVKILSDNNISYSDILLPGIARSIQAKDKIEISVSMDDDIFIAFNDEEFKLLGDEEESFSKIIVTKRGVEKI